MVSGAVKVHSHDYHWETVLPVARLLRSRRLRSTRPPAGWEREVASGPVQGSGQYVVGHCSDF